MFRVCALVLCLMMAGMTAWNAGLGAEATANAGPLFIAATQPTVHVTLVSGQALAFPVWADWLALAAALALAVIAGRHAFKTEPFSLSSAGRGVLALVLATAAARLASSLPDGAIGLAPRLHLGRAVLAFVIVGATAASFALAGFGRARYFSAFAGAFGLGLILALGLRQIAPAAAVVADWTLLFAAALAAALALRWDGAWSRWDAQVFAVLVCGLALAQLLFLTRPVLAGLGRDGLAALTALAALTLFPLLWPRPRRVA